MNHPTANIDLLLARIVEEFRLLLQENLVGIYLHGSLAMGGFNPQTSDVDFIVVVNEKLKTEVKRAIVAFTLELAKNAPKKGLEFSVVVLDATQHFVYPTPFEFHYSKAWHDVYESGQANFEAEQFDPDLAAHFMVIGKRGICLYGIPIDQVFADIPDTYYWASIASDAQDILNDIAQNPVYGILNLCRVLAFKREHLVTSKVEGGHWGLKNVNLQYHGLIQQALNDYEAKNPVDAAWDNKQLEDFAVYMKALL